MYRGWHIAPREVDVDDGIAKQIESEFPRMEIDIRKGEFDAPFRQGDTVKPECIGRYAGLIDFIEYGYDLNTSYPATLSCQKTYILFSRIQTMFAGMISFLVLRMKKPLKSRFFHKN